MQEAEHARVRELINRIESHLHRDELEPHLMQDNVCNPFIENSKKMIHDMGNVEYFELCKTDSQFQCSYRISDWAKGIFSMLVDFACVTRMPPSVVFKLVSDQWDWTLIKSLRI